MTKTEVIAKLEEKIAKKSNRARIVLTMENRKMVVDTITIQKDLDDGHINGNVSVTENGEPIPMTVTLMQVIELCGNPAITVDMPW